MRKYLTIYEEAVSHIWLCTRSLWISLYMRTILFYFLSVCSLSPVEGGGSPLSLQEMIFLFHILSPPWCCLTIALWWPGENHPSKYTTNNVNHVIVHAVICNVLKPWILLLVSLCVKYADQHTVDCIDYRCLFHIQKYGSPCFFKAGNVCSSN